MFANVLSILWEIISVFLGKLLYFLAHGLRRQGLLYEQRARRVLFLHILLFLTIIGAYMPTPTCLIPPGTSIMPSF